jgi:hypothetical protein
MTPKERLSEICDLLALGLIRLRLRLRQSIELFDVRGDSSLHIPPEQSGHAKPKRRRVA